jgi:hypothetical protein
LPTWHQEQTGNSISTVNRRHLTNPFRRPDQGVNVLKTMNQGKPWLCFYVVVENPFSYTSHLLFYNDIKGVFYFLAYSLIENNFSEDVAT